MHTKKPRVILGFCDIPMHDLITALTTYSTMGYNNLAVIAANSKEVF